MYFKCLINCLWHGCFSIVFGFKRGLTLFWLAFANPVETIKRLQVEAKCNEMIVRGLSRKNNIK